MRNKLNKCCLTILILCSCTGLYAQDTLNTNIYLAKKSRQDGLYLKGPVKSARWFYSYIKESLSPQKKQSMKLKNDVRNPFYVEFSPNGLLTKEILFSKDYFDMPIDSGKVSLYTYDLKDLQLKQEHHNIYFQIYPVYRFHLQLKPNFFIKGGLFGPLGFQYIYKYNDVGDIIEERLYVTDKDSLVKICEKDLDHIVQTTYNDKRQVIKQKIIKGNNGMEIFTALNTETPYCDDTQINYQYDDKGRITEIAFQSCGKVIFEETYTYAPDGNYVTLVNTMFRAVNSFPTNRMTAHYNEYGDITQMDFIPSPRPSYLPPATTVGENEPLHRYYDYDYDSHHNWIKCRLYLEGSKEGEPTAIAERKIEYYNEK